MTKLRGYIPTMLMLVTLTFGATAANAGILITNRVESTTTKSDDPCKEEKGSIFDTIATFVKTGILITNRTGILITNRTSQDTCGIIITN